MRTRANNDGKASRPPSLPPASSWRWIGVLPLAFALLGFLLFRSPDILVNSDGQHVAVRDQNGEYAFLRTKSDTFSAQGLLENVGLENATQTLDEHRASRCNEDACFLYLAEAGRRWSVLITRSRERFETPALAAACDRADIVISDRWLPRGCQPKWLKIDQRFLRQHGGVTIDLERQKIDTVRRRTGRLPWSRFPTPRED